MKYLIMNNLRGSISLFLGSYIQQYSIKFPGMSSSILSGVSLILELISLYELPLCTYVLLGSFHLLARSQIENHYTKVPLTIPQASGNILILLGCIVAIVFCGTQVNIYKYSQLQDCFKIFYFFWMLLSLAANLGLRYLGFYAGRVFYETSVPGQISTFGYAALKIIFLDLDLLFQGTEYSLFTFFFCSLVVFVSFGSSSSFLKYFMNCKQPDLVIIGYYFWVLCYCFPIGISILNPGVNYKVTEYCALGVSTLLIATGTFLHSYVTVDSDKLREEQEEEEMGLTEI
jgi:hypothetical protein